MPKFNSLRQFYKSKEWDLCKKSIAAEKMDREGFIRCEMCGKRTKAFVPNAEADNRNALVFHHKIPLTVSNMNDYNISLNPENIQCLCWQSHNEVHNRFNSRPTRSVYIVCGAVCSGKTTFVRENMTVGDCVLDMDLIWHSLSMQDLHIKPKKLNNIVFAVRETILDQIKMRSGMWDNAWVITTQNKPMELKRLADRLSAEIITLDTPKEECLRRLYENPDGRDLQLYSRLIEEYFSE